MALSEYMQNRLNYINSGRPLKEKKTYQIPKVSEKRKKKLAEQSAVSYENELDKFFENARKKMVNTCQCGCARKTSRDDDIFYRNCIAHIFPKRAFKSVATHPLNWVERAFFGGCHSQMDDTSMERWVNFADWDDIKEKFHVLAPLLTDEERATKFYSHLERLIFKL